MVLWCNLRERGLIRIVCITVKRNIYLCMYLFIFCSFLFSIFFLLCLFFSFSLFLFSTFIIFYSLKKEVLSLITIGTGHYGCSFFSLFRPLQYQAEIIVPAFWVREGGEWNGQNQRYVQNQDDVFSYGSLLMKSKSQQLSNFTNPWHQPIIVQREFMDLFVEKSPRKIKKTHFASHNQK